jgi:hypothetical protein
MAVSALLIGLQLAHRYPFEHNFHDDIDSPVLAIELATNAKALEAVLGTENPADVNPRTNPSIAVACLRTNTFKDFWFIPLYTLFLWQFAALFAIRADGSRMAHRRTIAGLAVLIAVLDCTENIGILRALGASRLSDFTAQAICWPSRGKWSLLRVSAVANRVDTGTVGKSDLLAPDPTSARTGVRGRRRSAVDWPDETSRH